MLYISQTIKPLPFIITYFSISITWAIAMAYVLHYLFISPHYAYGLPNVHSFIQCSLHFYRSLSLSPPLLLCSIGSSVSEAWVKCRKGDCWRKSWDWVRTKIDHLWIEKSKKQIQLSLREKVTTYTATFKCRFLFLVFSLLTRENFHMQKRYR